MLSPGFADAEAPEEASRCDTAASIDWRPRQHRLVAPKEARQGRNLVDPHCKQITCLVDINPAKQGRFLPGTGHRIVAPNQLSRESVTAAVVLNPNYYEEVSRLLKELGASIKIINLMDSEDTRA